MDIPLPPIAAAILVALFLYNGFALRRAKRAAVEGYRRWLDGLGLSEADGAFRGRVAGADVSFRPDHQTIRGASSETRRLRILTVAVTTDIDPADDWWMAERDVLERLVVTPPSLARSVTPSDDQLARELVIHTNGAPEAGPWQRVDALKRARERGLVWARALNGRLEAHYPKAGLDPQALEDASRLEVALYCTLRLSSAERDDRHLAQSHAPFRQGPATRIPPTMWGFPFALLFGGIASSSNALGLPYHTGWELFVVHAAAALVVALPAGAVLGAVLMKNVGGRGAITGR